MKGSNKDIMANDKGLTVIESVLILATISVVLFVGFAIFQASQDVVQIDDPINPEDYTEENSMQDIPEMTELDTVEDMESAIEMIEDIDLDSEERSIDELEDEI